MTWLHRGDVHSGGMCRRRAVLVALTVLSLGCSGQTHISASGATSSPVVRNANLAACARVRPIEGYDHQELAFVATDASGRGDFDAARAKATSQLLDRLVGRGGCGREALRPSIKAIGNRLDTAGYACAQVGVSNEDFERWKLRHRDTERGMRALRASMLRGIQRVVAAAANRGGSASVALVDTGVLSDEAFREAVAAQLRHALSETQSAGTPVAWDASWVMPPMPAQLDIALVAEHHKLGGEGEDVQIALRARFRRSGGVDGEQTFMTESVSRCLLPAPEPAVQAQRFRIDWGNRRSAGVHCAGDALRPKLVSLADTPLHVRVVNVLSPREALLVWPPGGNVGGTVAARGTVELAGAGNHWVAVESAMGVESMVVLWADNGAALDAELGLGAQQVCRLPQAVAARLHGSHRTTRRDVHTDVEQLRVLTGGECQGQADPERARRAEAVLVQLPMCR